jgi:transcriptional regulator with XRE-family HTH domain
MPRGLHSAKYALFRQLMTQQRKAAGLTQAELARRLRKPQSFVAKYETGERRLDLVEFLEIMVKVGRDPLEIVAALMAPRKGSGSA